MEHKTRREALVSSLAGFAARFSAVQYNSHRMSDNTLCDKGQTLIRGRLGWDGSRIFERLSLYTHL